MRPTKVGLSTYFKPRPKNRVVLRAAKFNYKRPLEIPLSQTLLSSHLPCLHSFFKPVPLPQPYPFSLPLPPTSLTLRAILMTVHDGAAAGLPHEVRRFPSGGGAFPFSARIRSSGADGGCGAANAAPRVKVMRLCNKLRGGSMPLSGPRLCCSGSV